MAIRLLAIAVYDRAQIKKVTPEMLAAYLRPLTDELDAEIEKAAMNRVGDCVDTMHMIEGVAVSPRGGGQAPPRQGRGRARLRGPDQGRARRPHEGEDVSCLRDGECVVVMNRIDGEDHITYR
jgi:hypothetical protein